MAKRSSRHIAFKSFYEHHFDRLFAFLSRRTGERETALDLAQDVFLKLWRNWDTLPNLQSAEAYLFTIARNRLIDHYRRQLARPQVPLTVQVENLPAPPEPELEETVHLQQLRDSIRELPEQRRKIVEMSKLEGKSTREIAEALSLSPRTVENQLYRAMQALRKKLAGWFFML